jgi:hypothetical protein
MSNAQKPITATWQTRDGQEIRICDMEDSHLARAIRMLERWRETGETIHIVGMDHDDEPFCDVSDAFSAREEEYRDLCRERNRRVATWMKRLARKVGMQCPDDLLDSF